MQYRIIVYNHALLIFYSIYGLCQYFSQKKTIKKVELYTEIPDTEHYVPLLSFNIKDKDADIVGNILDKKFGICVRSGFHCSPLAHKYMGTEERGTVRVCPSVFTTVKDIDNLINAVYMISYDKK